VFASNKYVHCKKCRGEWKEVLTPKKKREQRPAPAAIRRPRYVAPQFRTDFLLALPEMRRELERACAYDGAIFVESADPAFIPSWRKSA
jgi:hypothetical protein